MGLKYTNKPKQLSTNRQINLLIKLHYYILEKCSELLDWNQTRKAQFVAGFCAFTASSELVAIAILTHFNFQREHALHPIAQEYGVPFLALSCGLYLCLTFLGTFVKHTSDLIKDIYCFIVLLAYGIGALVPTYLLGSLSIAAGVALMVAPLGGLVLFKNSMILATSIVILPIATIIFLLVSTSKIPYNILLETTENLHQNTSILVFFYGAGTPFLLAGLFISYACIERWKQRENTVRILSTTDALTTLANRGVLLDEIQSYLSRPRMHRKTLSLMMMDLDDFKQVNDRFGHLVGDEVLKNISSTLKSVTREDDLVVRYGGEEFCILLPNTNRETAETIAKRILIAVKETMTRKNGNNVSITTSIGLTTANTQQLNSRELNVDMLLAAIDTGMYAAKDMGKNTMQFSPLPIKIV